MRYNPIRVPIEDLLTCVRASTAMTQNRAGVWSQVGNNVLRRAAKGGRLWLLAEESRTNTLPRSNTGGAALGVIGSGGALPTGWTSNHASGSAGAFEVVAVGDNHVDVQITQTGTTGLAIIGFNATSLATVAGDVRAFGLDLAIIAGSIDGTVEMRASIRDGADSGISSETFGDALVPTGTLQRFERTRTINTVGAVQARYDVRFLNTGTWTATFRLGLPQVENAAFCTSPIITAGSAVTRQADQIKLSDGLLAQLYGGGPMSVLAEFEMVYVPSGGGSPRVFQIDAGSNHNTIFLRPNENTGEMAVQAITGGATVFNNSVAYTSGALLKVATRLATDNFAASRNGGAVVTDTSGALPPGLVNLGIGNSGFDTTASGARLLRLSKLIIKRGAMSDANLQAWSA